MLNCVYLSRETVSDERVLCYFPGGYSLEFCLLSLQAFLKVADGFIVVFPVFA